MKSRNSTKYLDTTTTFMFIQGVWKTGSSFKHFAIFCSCANFQLVNGYFEAEDLFPDPLTLQLSDEKKVPSFSFHGGKQTHVKHLTCIG